jgi:hypothetical protein
MSYYRDLSGYLFCKDGVFTRMGTNKLCECDILGSFYTVEPAPVCNTIAVAKGTDPYQQNAQPAESPPHSK